KYWQALHAPPTLHIEMDPLYKKEFVDAYSTDTSFKARWQDSVGEGAQWHGGRRFYKANDGLLFFRDADFRPRLCVPLTQRSLILREAHESPLQTAHAG
ncbi:hypothetical protein PLICRDRAFT_70242, partial [Plicaturopsis crispa FD-325 SS-3]